MTAPRSRPDPDFAALLCDIRRHAQVSQLAVAVRAGCTQAFISQVERARAHPNPDIVSAYHQLTERSHDMQRRNLLAAAAAGLGLGVVTDAALASLWDRVLADSSADQWEATVHERGAQQISLNATPMRELLAADLRALTVTGPAGRVWEHAARLWFFYARTSPSNDAARDSYRRALAAADRSGSSEVIAWTHACIALSTCYEPRFDAVTADHARRALGHAGPGGSVAAIKANIALMHVAHNRGQQRDFRTHRDATLAATDGVDLAENNALYFSQECVMTSLSYASAREGDLDGVREWSRQAREAGAGERLVRYLGFHEMIAAHQMGDSGAPEQATAMVEALAADEQTIPIKALAVEAGALQYQ
jgi:transcriptional regulator with XRE-family HTH domain